MVDETEFDVMDADYESRLNDVHDNDDVYCTECGEEKDFSFLGSCANGDEWQCNSCSHKFIW